MKSAYCNIYWFDGLYTYKMSAWAQLRCSSTQPLMFQNVLADISKTLRALSNSDCLVLSGSPWSCWVFQTEVPVPCGCPRSAETGGRLWWIIWGTGVPTRASGFNSRNGGLAVNHMEKLGNCLTLIQTNTQNKLLSFDFIWAPIYYIFSGLLRCLCFNCTVLQLPLQHYIYDQKIPCCNPFNYI